MAYLLGLPLIALLAILQSTILTDLHFYNGRPDLVLLAVVGWALAGRSTEAMVWGLVGGLILDTLSATPQGISALALILIAYLVSLYERRIWEAHFLMPLGIVLIASLLYQFVGVGTVIILGRSIDIAYALGRVVLPSTFLNLLLAIPSAQAASSLAQRLYPPEVEI